MQGDSGQCARLVELRRSQEQHVHAPRAAAPALYYLPLPADR